MNRTDLSDLHPVELALVALLALGWAAATIARVLLVPLLALLLTMAGWRPEPPAAALEPAAPAPAPEAPEPALARLTVAALRRRARAAGLSRELCHRGRRADLLAALT